MPEGQATRQNYTVYVCPTCGAALRPEIEAENGYNRWDVVCSAHPHEHGPDVYDGMPPSVDVVPRSVLADLARWWAVEMAGNEVQIRGYVPPEPFLELVAGEMVRNEFLGWPDVESARAQLSELYSADA